jgi:hypothetical protein
MEEETYYSDGTNRVTNQRLIFGETEYPLDDLVDVRRLATFSSAVTWVRRGIIPAAVLLLVFSIFLEWNASDPGYAVGLLIVNIVAIVSTIAIVACSFWVSYCKQPTVRTIILDAVGLVVLTVLYVWGLSSNDLASRVTPFVSALAGAGAIWLFRVLGQFGTFGIRLIERTCTVDVFSSSDRQLVENLIGFIRLALVKRPNATQANVKSPA